MTISRRLAPSIAELTAFSAAARFGSFTEAARALSLTQSAVSKQVRQLERSLGRVLLDRVGRRIVLTEAGRIYLREVEEILAKLQAATHVVRAGAGTTASLALAVLPTFATRWLIPRLPFFFADNPDVGISCVTRPEPFDFEREPFDLAIHYGSPDWPNTSATHLFDEEVVPVASRAYVTSLRLQRPEDLDRATLLQQATRPNLWADWFNRVGMNQLRAHRGPLFDQFSMTTQAAVAGLGVALVPRFLIDTELTAQKLVIVFKQSLRSEKSYFVITPIQKRNEPVVARFVSWMEGRARSATEEQRKSILDT